MKKRTKPKSDSSQLSKIRKTNRQTSWEILAEMLLYQHPIGPPQARLGHKMTVTMKIKEMENLSH